MTNRSLLQDLAIQSNTPRWMVDDYLKSFHELHQEGGLDRQLVIKSLYVWEAEGGREGGREGKRGGWRVISALRV